MTSRNILLADADVASTVQMVTELIAAGHTIETVTNVVDAARRLREHAIDLAIVCEQLPGGGAAALLDACQPMPCPAVVIVQESGTCSPSGCDVASLPRGSEPSELTALVHDLLDVPHPHAQEDRRGCRALVVEDDPDHQAMIRDCLARNGREQIELICAGTVTEACQLLEGGSRYDFVLLDHNLPDGTGFDVLQRMGAELITTPVIGLSTSRDPEVALGDFRGGAIEFIAKHEAFRGETLRRRVFEVVAEHRRRLMACAIERRREHMTLSGQQERLLAESRLDGLLGIFNRSAFDEYLAAAHERAAESKQSYALCMVDVDHFKRYNDHYGHARGDDVLQKVTAALQDALREGDFIARWGGEEIAIVIEAIENEALAVVLDRCCSNVSQLAMEHERSDADGPGVVTVSIGATTFDPESDETMHEVFDRADMALFDAKAAGRNRVVIAPPREDPEQHLRQCA